MAFNIFGTGGRGDDPKKTPEEIAEERIEAARKAKTRRLDLSGLGLTELPVSIGQLDQLQRLDIHDNRLTVLPDFVGKWTQLRELYLSGNEVTVVPQAIGELTQLRQLSLANTRLTAVPEFLGRLTRLETLWLNENLLKELPEAIGRLGHLDWLNLSNNVLTALPEALAQLNQLRVLLLGGNQLSMLPESLRRITSLKVLELHGNVALGLPLEVLGPSGPIFPPAKPAKPSRILDYYFAMNERRVTGGRRIDTISGGTFLPMDKADLQPIRVAFSYSHKDEELRDQLETHLKLLQRQGVISTWHDRKILGGENWAGVIDDNFKRADLILLLVSADFLASDYCYQTEMGMALEREAKGEARVVPVVLRACDWKGAPFGKLQGFPKDMKPVTSWPNRDEAWTDVAAGIRKVAEQLRKREV